MPDAAADAIKVLAESTMADQWTTVWPHDYEANGIELTQAAKNRLKRTSRMSMRTFKRKLSQGRSL